MANGDTYIQKIIRVFVTYSSRDRVIAGNIRAELERYGLAVFLAHEDIQPTRVWRETILTNLRACDVFMLVLTENFPHSKWVDQETGIAFALEKFIIPLKLDIDPYGFIEQYQALKMDLRTYRVSCKRIIDLIGERDELSEALKDCVIRSFLDSNTYDQANRRASMLLDFGPYTKAQLNEIVRGSARNNQIYQGFTARDVVAKLRAQHPRLVDRTVWEEFKRRADIA